MFFDASHAVSILEHYKYLLIFPIAIVEGPIIIIISGFLVYLGVLNFFVAYIVLVIADTIGDCLYYLLGKGWRTVGWIKKIGNFLGYNERSEKFLENHFQKHTVKTLLLSKVSHGIGGSIQIAAGMAGVNFLQFVFLNTLGTMVKAFILLSIGYYAGTSYLRIDGYLNRIAIITLGLFVLAGVWLFLNKYIKGILKKKD